MTALGEALRGELAPQGVGVTLLLPGYVETNLAASTAKLGGEVRQYSGVLLKSDVTAARVGEMVAEAIERDEPYVVTHKGVWPAVEKRFAAIKAACDLREQA